MRMAGLLRGATSRGDLVRPGIALYGGQALADSAFCPAPVVRWQARILKVRTITRTTSVGYGVAFGGATALLGMLTSCSSNVTVVNIDNGFGAAYVATLINRL